MKSLSSDGILQTQEDLTASAKSSPAKSPRNGITPPDLRHLKKGGGGKSGPCIITLPDPRRHLKKGRGGKISPCIITPHDPRHLKKGRGGKSIPCIITLPAVNRHLKKDWVGKVVLA